MRWRARTLGDGQVGIEQAQLFEHDEDVVEVEGDVVRIRLRAARERIELLITGGYYSLRWSGRGAEKEE